VYFCEISAFLSDSFHVWRFLVYYQYILCKDFVTHCMSYFNKPYDLFTFCFHCR